MTLLADDNAAHAAFEAQARRIRVFYERVQTFVAEVNGNQAEQRKDMIARAACIGKCLDLQDRAVIEQAAGHTLLTPVEEASTRRSSKLIRTIKTRDQTHSRPF